MKLHIQNGQYRSELPALTPVVALLVAGVFAKLGVATQLFHLVH